MPSAHVIPTGFDPDDEQITRLHALALGDDYWAVTPWEARHGVTWVGAFQGDDLVAFVHVVWDGGEH